MSDNHELESASWFDNKKFEDLINDPLYPSILLTVKYDIYMDVRGIFFYPYKGSPDFPRMGEGITFMDDNNTVTPWDSENGDHPAMFAKFPTAEVKFLITFDIHGNVLTLSDSPYFKVNLDGTQLAPSSLVPDKNIVGHIVKTHRSGDANMAIERVPLGNVPNWRTPYHRVSIVPLSMKIEKSEPKTGIIATKTIDNLGVSMGNMITVDEMMGLPQEVAGLWISSDTGMIHLKDELNTEPIISWLRSHYQILLKKFEKGESVELRDKYRKLGDVAADLVTLKLGMVDSAFVMFPNEMEEYQDTTLDEKLIAAEVMMQGQMKALMDQLAREETLPDFNDMRDYVGKVAYAIMDESGAMMTDKLDNHATQLNAVVEAASQSNIADMTAMFNAMGDKMHDRMLEQETILAEQEGMFGAHGDRLDLQGQKHEELQGAHEELHEAHQETQAKQQELIDADLVFDGTLVKHEGVHQALHDRATEGEITTSKVHQAAVKGHQILANDVVGLTEDLAENAGMRQQQHDMLSEQVEVHKAERIREAKLQKQELTNVIDGHAENIDRLEDDINNELIRLKDEVITGETLKPIIDLLEKQLDHLQEEIAYEGTVLGKHIDDLAVIKNAVESVMEKISGIPSLEDDLITIRKALDDIELQVVTGFDMAVEHYNLDDIHRQIAELEESEDTSWCNVIGAIVLILLIAVVMYAIYYIYKVRSSKNVNKNNKP